MPCSLQELLRDALSVSTFGWQKLCSDSHHSSVLLRVYCQTVVAGVTYRRLDHDLVYIENLAVVRSEQGRPEVRNGARPVSFFLELVS